MSLRYLKNDHDLRDTEYRETDRSLGVLSEAGPVFAASSDAHEGHQPRFLHENPTTRSMPHDPQWTRKSPRDRTPHPRKARNSRSTMRGTSCSADRCAARNVSNSEATTLYRIVCSG